MRLEITPLDGPIKITSVTNMVDIEYHRIVEPSIIECDEIVGVEKIGTENIPDPYDPHCDHQYKLGLV